MNFRFWPNAAAQGGDSAEEYDWMNRIVGVGMRRREPIAVYYDVVEAL
ncbi:MAG: hypothetical protein WCE38_10150 [Burkholderiales bacterium]